MDQGQEGTGRRKKKDPILPGECSCAVIRTTSIFLLLKNIKKPWYYPSRRLVIGETLFHIPDLTPLPNVPRRVTTQA